MHGHMNVKDSGGIDPLILKPPRWMEVSGQLHAPAILPSRKKPSTRWIAGWMDSSAGLAVFAKRQISCRYRNLNPESPKP
jgi:hypothetical protein